MELVRTKGTTKVSKGNSWVILFNNQKDVLGYTRSDYIKLLCITEAARVGARRTGVPVRTPLVGLGGPASPNAPRWLVAFLSKEFLLNKRLSAVVFCTLRAL